MDANLSQLNPPQSSFSSNTSYFFVSETVHKYSEIVHRLFYDSDTNGKLDLTLFGHLFSQIRCIVFLKAIAKFLGSNSNKRPTTWGIEDPVKQGRSQVPNVRADVIEKKPLMCTVGMSPMARTSLSASRPMRKVEFLLPDGCYGTLG